MTAATTPGLSPSVRRGYGLGSVATGAFGTVPGLLLLPYLTDRIGIAAGVAGVIVFAPKAWDVVLNPIAGRISDRSHAPRTASAGRSSSAPGCCWPACFVAALRRADLPVWAGRRLGGGGVPRLRHGLRLLPGALRRDAGRDDRRLRRAHPADDLAGRDPRARDPRQRRRCRRSIRDALGPEWGYRAVGLFVGGAHRARRVGRLARHPNRAGAARGAGRALLRRPAAGRRGRIGRSALLLTTFVAAGARHRARCSRGSTTSRWVLSAAPASATLLFVCFVAPALLVTPAVAARRHRRGKRSGYLFASLLLGGGRPGPRARRARCRTASSTPCVAVVGVGYAGAPDVPASRCCPTWRADSADGATRVGLYTGVWTAGETLGLALGPRLYAAVLALGGYVSSTRGRLSPSPTRRSPRSRSASPSCRPSSSRSALLVPAPLPRLGPGGRPMTAPTTAGRRSRCARSLR